MGVEAEFSVEPVEGLALSLSGSVIESEFDSTLLSAGGVVIAGIREGNRLPSVPSLQVSAAASYSFPVGEGSEAYVGASVQHASFRWTQPGDQELASPTPFVHGLPFGGAPANATTLLDVRAPSYEYVNLSAGIDFANGLGVMLYVNNLFDENARLSFDRERGGRARLGFHVSQPRVIGITVRQRFGN